MRARLEAARAARRLPQTSGNKLALAPSLGIWRGNGQQKQDVLKVMHFTFLPLRPDEINAEQERCASSGHASVAVSRYRPPGEGSNAISAGHGDAVGFG